LLSNKRPRRRQAREPQKSPRLRFRKLARASLLLIHLSLRLNKKKRSYRDRPLLPRRQRFWMPKPSTRLWRSLKKR
jgi:hypothetical protein